MSARSDYTRPRHTYGAMLRRAGVPPEDREEYLGHAPRTVTDRYTSPIEEEAAALDNMQRLALFLARGDTEARIAQLDGEPVRVPLGTAESVLAALADDRDGFERLVSQLRQQVEGGEEA